MQRSWRNVIPICSPTCCAPYRGSQSGTRVDGGGRYDAMGGKKVYDRSVECQDDVVIQKRWPLKPFKFLFMSVVAVLVLVGTAAVGVSIFLDPNDYRDELSRLVKENTGRDLVIREGAIISFFPRIGIKAQAVELGNAAGFGPEPFASIASLEVRVRLEPLLQKRVEADTIVVKGLTLNLSRNAQGVGNWEDLGKGSQKPPTPPNSQETVPSPGTDEGGASAIMAAVVFQGIEVEDGVIRWHDALAGEPIRLEKLGLVVGRFVPGMPMALEMHTEVLRTQPSLAATVSLKGLATVDLVQGKINTALESMRVALADSTGKADGMTLAMMGDLSVNLADMGLALTMEKVEFNGSESALNGLTVQSDFKGMVVMDPTAHTVKVDLKQLGLEAGGTKLAGIKAHAGMDIDALIDLATMTVAGTLSGLNMETREGALKEGFVRMESSGRIRADLAQKQGDVELTGMSVKGEGAVFSGGGFSGRMEMTVKADMEKRIVETILDKATLELTGGVLKTGGGEFKFHSNTRMVLDTSRLDGRLEAVTFALHGPLVDNGRVEGGVAVDWNMTLGGGAIEASLRDLDLRVQDGFMGAGGKSRWGCQAKVRMLPAEGQLQGSFTDCHLDARGTAVGGGQLEGRFSGGMETHLKEGWLRLKPMTVAMKNTGGTLVPGDSRLEGNFDLTMDLDGQHYTAVLTGLAFENTGELFQGGSGKVALTGHVDADLKQGTVRTSATKLELVALGGAVGHGRLHLSGPVEIHTQLDGPHVRTALKDMALSFQGENAPGGSLDGTLTGTVDADMKTGIADLSGVEFNAAGAKVSGAMKLSGLGQQPVWEGTWRLHEFNLANTMKKLRMDPVTMRDGRVLQKVGLTMTVKGGNNRLSLEGIELVLDESHLKGQLKAVSMTPLDVAFDFNVDTLNLDRYREPEDKSGGRAKGSSGKETQDAQKSKGSLGLPNMKGQIRFGKLTVSDLRMTDAVATISSKDGVLGIHPVEARLYQGSLKGDVDMDFRAGKPKTVLKAVLTSVQGGPLLADVMGMDRITGQANANIDLSMHGLESDEIKRTLTGNSHFAFTNGALKGINMAKMIRTTYQVVKGQAPEGGDNMEQTDFSEFSASIKLDHGLATNRDLTLKSPLLRVSGDGQADLPKDSVNYQLRVAVVGSLVGQGGKAITELKNITVPIRVTGSPTRPKYQVDLKGLIQENVKEEAKQKIMEKIEKKLDDGLRDKLKSKGLDGVLQQVVPKGLDGIFNKLPF